MQPLIITATEGTPYVHFDAEKNIFEIKGESRPENTKAYYEPIIEWVKNFCSQAILQKSLKNKIVFTMSFDYFSSSSAKYLMNIFAKLEDLYKNDIPVEVLWTYEEVDIEMKEAGEEFKKLLSLPFNFKSIND